MAERIQVKTRRSLRELEKEYENRNREPLEKLWLAWKTIKELPPDDSRSFFKLGGFHGEPFRGAGWGNAAFWGGYCMHGNILFPTWHRIYLLKLEQALQSVPGCENVTLPYWDETDADSLKNGVPWSLTIENVPLPGLGSIPNPLRSFKFPITITDNVSSDDNLYTKPKGYETVRYPYSGLVGTPEAAKESAAHNAKFTYQQATDYLNKNVVGWLNNTISFPPPIGTRPQGVLTEFQQCLNAPNYTVFSNTTSSQQWNDLNDGAPTVFSLESPHNHIHLAVGGFDVPNQGDWSNIDGANGDMGENDTAGLDPIFYFHHCNIDRVFWIWQKKHHSTDHLDIIPEYPGTNTTDNQGPTPGVQNNQWLDLNTPMPPFYKNEAAKEYYTSKDAINIEKIGYTYSIGSLDQEKWAAGPVTSNDAVKYEKPTRKLAISKINRAPIAGSFVINAFVTIEGKKYYLGSRSVLSRWATQGCANCQTHLEVKAFFDVDFLGHERLAAIQPEHFHVEINGRKKAAVALARLVEKNQYQLELR